MPKLHIPLAVVSALAIALLSLGTACSSETDGTYVRPKVWPKPTEPEPASPVYHEVDEWIPSEEDIARSASEHNALLTEEVEQALSAKDAIRRETVFVHILPELLQVEPQRLVELHSRLEPGASRELLCTEMAEQWSSSDPVAAARWMKSLEKEERRSASVAALTNLAAREPETARLLADALDLERGDPVRKLLSPLSKPTRDAASN
ncbi:MAG TPA: hypothetical protein VF033_07600 [Steroidobacteraceae bacterium]